MTDPNTTAVECRDCGVGMQTAKDGALRCPYCNSWAFRDAVSDGAIYAAASQTTIPCPKCGALESAFNCTENGCPRLTTEIPGTKSQTTDLPPCGDDLCVPGCTACRAGGRPVYQATELSRYDRIMLPVASKLQDLLWWLENLVSRKS